MLAASDVVKHSSWRGLATVHSERVGRRRIEITRVKITNGG